jgi:DNA replication protein DnaC
VLETAITKLDKYHLLILGDLAYVTKDQAETSVLFELISAHYERRSLLITANQPFGEWGEVSTVSVDESEQAVPRHAGEHSELQERFAEGTATPRHWDYLNTNFSKTGPLG